jgi:flagellar basal body-associated protein FliL
MNLQFITKFFKKSGNDYTKGERHRVVRHWVLLLTLFFVLLCAVGAAGFFLYQHFILDGGLPADGQAEQKTLLDEKKLKAVIERFEKRTIPTETGSTTAPRFIDPSVPF